MIQKFISGLSDTGKKLLAVALIFIVAALFDRLLIGPTMSRMAAIDQDIVKEESVIKQDMHFLQYKDKIMKEGQALDAYVAKDSTVAEEVIAAFLKKLDVIAAKANVTIGKVTPSAGVVERDYVKYQADLECSGVLADVVTFMHMLDSSDELTKVVRFNFSSKKADTDEIKASMSVVKAVIAKSNTKDSSKPAAQATGAAK